MLDVIFFFKQKTAYEMRISDWSSDVCSSDLSRRRKPPATRRAARWTSATLLASRIRLNMLSPKKAPPRATDRKSDVEGKRVSVRVDLGGRRIIKKKKKRQLTYDGLLTRNHYCISVRRVCQ